MSQGAPKAARGVLFWLGTGIVTTALFCAAFGPLIVPYDPTLTSGAVSLAPPSPRAWPSLMAEWAHGGPAPHFFGTDAAGLDVFSRTVVAARTDLTIALASNVLSFVVGVGLGVLTGYYRNIATEMLLRGADLMQSFPVFISAMILVALAGRSWLNIIIAISFLYMPIYLRLTRTKVLTVMGAGYVEAARALGVPSAAIARRHILPNAIGPATIQFSVTIGFAILLTAGLSFVGAGVRPPTPEWGAMISSGAAQIVLGDWWPALFPGLAISLTVFGFAVLGHVLEQRFG